MEAEPACFRRRYEEAPLERKQFLEKMADQINR